jgi:hypothetical protein
MRMRRSALRPLDLFEEKQGTMGVPGVAKNAAGEAYTFADPASRMIHL